MSLAAGLPPQTPEDLSEATTLARSYHESRRWKELRSLLEPLEMQLAPTEAGFLAQAYVRTNQMQRGLEVYQRALKRAPDSETLWLGLIDLTLEREQYGTALRRFSDARRRIGPTAELCYRAARAYYRMGQALGRTRVIRAPQGKAGQYVEAGLLLEKRGAADRFLCCPPESAMYMLRRALDAGLEEPAAHWLHARLWVKAGRAEVGLAILKNQEDRWMREPEPEAARVMADTALAAGELADYLRYARRLAELQPKDHARIMHDACVDAARQYNLRGDAAMCRELLRRAVKLDDSDHATILRLADALWESDEREEAALWYRRLLECEPEHSQRRRILERLGP